MLPLDPKKRLRELTENLRSPNGVVSSWGFSFLRQFGSQAVISLDAFRQRKHDEKEEAKWKLPWT